MIDAPLLRSNIDSKTNVQISYIIPTETEVPGIAIIEEANYEYSLGDPKLNPKLEIIEIASIQVTKTNDSFSKRNAYFSFCHAGIYYVLEFQNLPNGEGLKIVKSIISQLR